MLRSVTCSPSLGSTSLFFRFFRQFPRSFSSTTAVSRNIRRLSTPEAAGRRLFLSRGFKLRSATSRSLSGQFSRLSIRAVATQPAPSYLGQDDAEKLGFEKVSEEFISECKSKAVLFKHKKTGCEVMSVSNDDENKVFGIVFRTPPKDSTGIPHILEHSVLCGSRKYPLKEPFVELLKGSLHTFLNAFTYPDRTCYPVASTNTKDFYNLVDVYLDAVFFPKCVDDVHTFQQEGWHYELNDPSEDISYKGVVFNEMKGVYSQPDNILGRITQQALCPDNTYGVDSGGDPKDIPKLKFEEFKEFHRQYYHPSNARIWFYGDDEPVHRLRVLSEYLDMFDASPARDSSKVEPQKLFSGPRRIVEKYPAGEDGDLTKKHMVCLNWLLSDKPLDLQTQLALEFLEHLMLGTPASPLRKILLESGLGEALVNSGMEDELLQPQFSIGLKGVSDDNVQKVEELIMTTLRKLADEGFDTDAVEASMNTIEFSLRESNTGSFPRGLSLMLQSIAKWIYDMDPFEPLKYEEPLKSLKARIAEKGSKAVFSPLIEEFILKNPHCVTIEMQPDSEIVGDINGVKVLRHDLFTNDILYTEVVFDLGSLKHELLPLLPLFCQSLLEMGTQDLTFVQLNQLIGRKTGGISVYPLTSSVWGRDDPCSKIIVRGKSMVGRAEDLFHLMKCVLQEVRFTDQQRFKQFVSQSRAGMENHLRGSGQGIAATRMEAMLNAAGWMSEQMGGLRLELDNPFLKC
ncbi:PREDICTED: presequence protease 2, chloroplastic/mitochondrial-like [Camelina sativa]|uniref:Presequence protease 2, chloroplastic/mitochondrial-like n=1 Tax=Camelina sativa TaxID=90675 RepID=A0ABM0X5K0_CAMSA|nr:PREDICTED: presequence protease 2, chloroplastic/mitochondrial-like [Camelina sativa]